MLKYLRPQSKTCILIYIYIYYGIGTNYNENKKTKTKISLYIYYAITSTRPTSNTLNQCRAFSNTSMSELYFNISIYIDNIAKECTDCSMCYIQLSRIHMLNPNWISNRLDGVLQHKMPTPDTNVNACEHIVFQAIIS